jgi:SAM-dependent methyltransferase
MFARPVGAVRRHGVGGATALGISVVIVGAAKWLDRRLRLWPARRARIARAARALCGAASPGARAEFSSYALEETIRSLGASTRYCYERRATVWLYRHLMPAAVRPPFYGQPMAAAVDAVGPSARVLALGCRDELELVLLGRAMPAAAIVGLDLFSWHRRIVRGDMHALPFITGAFDLVVASHSLEHAWDVNQAATELLRVTRGGGVLAIEVPVKHLDHRVARRQTHGADRWDFSNLRALRETFAGASPRPLSDLFGRDSSPGARSVQWVARIAGPPFRARPARVGSTPVSG